MAVVALDPTGSGWTENACEQGVGFSVFPEGGGCEGFRGGGRTVGKAPGLCSLCHLAGAGDSDAHRRGPGRCRVWRSMPDSPVSDLTQIC